MEEGLRGAEDLSGWRAMGSGIKTPPVGGEVRLRRDQRVGPPKEGGGGALQQAIAVS